jgi:class 3 adenylate cyclase
MAWRRAVPIQVYIATLFIGLGLMLGISTTLLGYTEIKNLSVAAAHRTFRDFARSVAGTIAQSRSNISTSLDFIANDPVSRSTTLNSRLEHLGTLKAALHVTPQLSAVYVGYPNGDIIELRRLAGVGGYLVQSIERRPGAQPVRTFIYYDSSLRVLRRAAAPNFRLDPRSRPWFRDARAQVEATSPYFFYTTRQAGITLTLLASNGSVAAADVDLTYLSHLLAQGRPTSSTLAAIIDSDGTVIAYSDPAKMLAVNRGVDRTQLAPISQFGAQPLVQAFMLAGTQPSARGTFRDSTGATWLYEAEYSTPTASGQRRVFTAVSQDDLLGAARSIRNRMLLLGGLILLAWLPVAWWMAALVARPLKRLDRQAEAIRNLDFSEQPHETSTIAEIEQLSQTFGTMRTRVRDYNEAAARFVPFEFLEHLAREDIIAVQLGDHSEEDMAVLFSDIRSFTTLSERMSPQETFDFLNAYLGEVGPIVREHGGFIDKYIGDAIMALFPSSDDAVVDTAIAMQKRAAPLAIGIGVNRGPLMLGTIGERKRFETTVIADAVNVASRIESLTKTLGVKILVSGHIAANLDGSRYHLRELCAVQVKGTTRPTVLYEVFDADPPELIAHKLDTANAFAKARTAYLAGDFAQAGQLFARLAELDPRDGPALWFSLRSAEFAAAVPPDWTGIERLDFK